MPPTVAIFARYPEPGKAKTRLIPALGAEGAARIYARLLEGTMEAVRESGLPFVLHVSGGEPAAFHAWLGDDCAIVRQGEGDLGARLARVPAPALVIGSDCPGLSAPILRAAAHALEERPVVIGPASDGGYYLIGFRDPVPFLFDAVAWSTATVFAETVRRAAARGLGLAVLPELADVDVPEDLVAWPHLQ